MPSGLEHSCVYNALTIAYLSFMVVLSSVRNFVTSLFLNRSSLHILPIQSAALTPAQHSQGLFVWLSTTIKSLAIAVYRFFNEMIFQIVDICLWYTPQYRERASASWSSFSWNVKRKSSDMKTRVILAFRPASSFNLPVAVVGRDDGSWDFRDAEKPTRPMTWLLFDPVRGCVTPSGTGIPRMPRAERTPSTLAEAAPALVVTVSVPTPPPSVPLPLFTAPPLRENIDPGHAPSAASSDNTTNDAASSESSADSPSVYSSPPSLVSVFALGEEAGDAVNVSELSNDPDMDIADMSPANMFSVPELSVSASDDSISIFAESVEMDISECNDYLPRDIVLAKSSLSPVIEQEEVCRISSATVHTFSAFPFGDIYHPRSYSKHILNHEPSSSVYDLDSSSTSSPSSCYSGADTSESDTSSGFVFSPSDSRSLPVNSQVDIRRGPRRNGMNLGLGSLQGVNWWQELASSSRLMSAPPSGQRSSARYGVSKASERDFGLAIRLSSALSERNSRPSCGPVDPAIDMSENVHEDLELSSVDVDCSHSAALTIRPAFNSHASVMSWVTFRVPDTATKQSILSANLDLDSNRDSDSRPPSFLSSDELSQENFESVTSISICDIPSAPTACAISTSSSESNMITEAEAKAAARRVSLHGKLPRLRNSTRPSYTVWDEVRRTRYIPSLTTLQQRRALANLIYDSDLQGSRRVGLHGKLPRERPVPDLATLATDSDASPGDKGVEAMGKPFQEQTEGGAPGSGLRSLMLPARVGMRPFVGGPQPVPAGTPPVRF